MFLIKNIINTANKILNQLILKTYTWKTKFNGYKLLIAYYY